MSGRVLPEGWVMTTLGELCELNPKHKLDDELDVGFMPMSGVPTSFHEKPEFETRKWEAVKKGYTQFKGGDVLFAKITPCFENGKAAIVEGFPNGWGAGSTEYYVLRPYAEAVDPRLLLAFVRTKEFLVNGEVNMSGSVGHKRVPKEFVAGYPFPLMPATEQTILADKLDELLAQVNNLKARLDATPAILKRFRQSVLAAAVSGKLTSGWRAAEPNVKKQSLEDIDCYWMGRLKAGGKRYKKLSLSSPEEESKSLPECWVHSQIGYVFSVYVGATPNRSEARFWNGDIPWVSSAEVAFCRINDTKERITQEGLRSTSTELHPKGTVMLAMIGQGKTRGQPALLDVEACHNQNTAALEVPVGFCVPEFLYYYLWEQYEETRMIGGGNNQMALNKKKVQELPFPLPPFEEQKEISRRVDQLFAFADQVEQQVKNAQACVNKLTQSILTKAFRGELTAEWRAVNSEMISGENSAEALLERLSNAGKKTRDKKKVKE